jgi:hypothetical protein
MTKKTLGLSMKIMTLECLFRGRFHAGHVGLDKYGVLQHAF